MKQTLVFIIALAFAPLAALLAAPPDVVLTVPGDAATTLPPLDAYGGATTIKAEATGYFYLKGINGRWFFITPEGHGFIPLGVNHLKSYFSGERGRLRPGESDLVRQLDGGDLQRATDRVVAMLKDWGFNCAGYDAPPAFQQRLPFSAGFIQVRASAVVDNVTFEDVFSPAYARDLDSRVAVLCKPLRENRHLLGYYLADLPLWGDRKFMDKEEQTRGESWLSFFRKLPDETPGKRAYNKFIGNEQAFIAEIADQIYRLTSEAFRRRDPNHLVLGERYAGNRLFWPVIEKAAKYFPVVAVQLGGGFDADLYRTIYRRTGRPVISVDHVVSFVTPLTPNVRGGQPLASEAEAAAVYTQYLRNAFSEPFMLGYNRCQLMSRIRMDGRPPIYKQGLLDPQGKPYATLVRAVRAANHETLARLYPSSKVATHE